MFVGIEFCNLKKNGKLWILNFVVCGILADHLLYNNIINGSLENWYLSKLNETTVNKSHDDILIEYLKNISTETISSQNSRK
jgi:hypothetical protein